MSKDQPTPTRLFRVSSPSDVICASIVAGLLPPGHDILALSTDKSHGVVDEYRECFHSLARIHPWKNVVDLSGIPIMSQFQKVLTLRNRFRGIGLFIASIHELRARLASAVSVPTTSPDFKHRIAHSVDELYLTCPHHPDVLALCQVLSAARKIYYPHTLDSIGFSEIGHYASVCDSQSIPLRSTIFGAMKRVVWGDDAVPRLRVKIDAAYSFRLPFPWADEQYAINDMINSATMQKLFSTLPAPVQAYFQDLAQKCGNAGLGVLVINAEDFAQFIPAELDAYRLLAQRLATRCEGGTILVKPHSRGGADHTNRVLEFLRSGLPEVTFLPIARYHFYPIEVVLAPFHAVACAGLGTTSLRTLGLIYGLDAYCPVDRLRTIYGGHAKIGAIYDRWVEDFSSSVIHV